MPPPVVLSQHTFSSSVLQEAVTHPQAGRHLAETLVIAPPHFIGRENQGQIAHNWFWSHSPGLPRMSLGLPLGAGSVTSPLKSELF